MSNLVDEIKVILGKYSYIEKEFFFNKNYLKDIRYIYISYQAFSKKYLPLANKQNKNIVRNIYTKIRLLSSILTFKIYQTQKANCEDIEYKNLIKNIKILKQMSLNPKYKNQTFYYEDIFKNNILTYTKLQVTEKYCPKLKKDTEEVMKYFNAKMKKSN